MCKRGTSESMFHVPGATFQVLEFGSATEVSGLCVVE